MASNPMQRKVRNSFLLGILVMLVIVILIGAIVFFAVIKPKMSSDKEQITAEVYKLKEGVSVKYGEEITSSMVESVEIPVATQTNTAGFILAKKQDDSTGKKVKVNFPSGYKSKIDLTGGTILTRRMLYEEEIENSLRYVEYNMITIPTNVDISDYVDIRLRISNTQDFIVISKKEIINLYENTVGLNLTEDEILTLNSAIVEAYVMNGAAELYMAKYVQADMQTAATHTYVPTVEVQDLIRSNVNITQAAKEYLANRYIPGLREYYINPQVNQYAEGRRDNIEAGIQKQIEAARKAREDYLSELEGI